MRTTITLDPDVVAQLEALRRERGWSFKEAVNATLRRGFSTGGDGGSRPYVMPVRALGVKPGVGIDRIRDELAGEADAGLRA